MVISAAQCRMPTFPMRSISAWCKSAGLVRRTTRRRIIRWSMTTGYLRMCLPARVLMWIYSNTVMSTGGFIITNGLLKMARYIVP